MTPLEKSGSIYFKREDQNVTGSAKDRALPLQVEKLKNLGFKKAVISSTGNAAISAQYFCTQAQISLTTFVSPHIHPQKLEKLKNYQISHRPISDAIKFSKQENAYFLRQSTDPISLLGYQEIAKEILVQLPQVSSIFIPVGSGTTLLGISQALPKNVKIFAVQPASFCPIASLFDKNFTPESESITDSLGVKYLPLKKQVITACTSAVVIQNQEIINQSVNTSAEGALALAGYQKICHQANVGNFPVILFTGTKR